MHVIGPVRARRRRSSGRTEDLRIPCRFERRRTELCAGKSGADRTDGLARRRTISLRKHDTTLVFGRAVVVGWDQRREVVAGRLRAFATGP